MEYIKEYGLLSKGQNVGAAVSGGADSMALLNCLCSISKVYNITVFAVHFEHGLRGKESLADADFVIDYCVKHNIPYFMGAADVKVLAEKWGLSIQSGAKKAREEYFEKLVESGELDVIATAHHKDDNAESVLMHILRGCGISGLWGIHPKINCYIRPFLCIDRNDILFYLKQNGINFVEDKTNSENKYTRNYLRNVILPQIKDNINKDVNGALNRLCSIARADGEYLDKCAQKSFLEVALVKNNSVELNTQKLVQLETAIFARVIQLSCKALHVIADVEYSHINALRDLAKKNKTGNHINISNLLCGKIEYEKLIICFLEKTTDYSFSQELNVHGTTKLIDRGTFTCEIANNCDFYNDNKYCECFDFDKFPKNILIRTRMQGDVICPLGVAGSKKLKDYFIDKKLPREDREKAIMLAWENNIIWIVGHVISNDYAVTKNTKKILKITYNVEAN